MTETLIKEWFKRLPDWVFTLSSLIFLALLIGISIMVWIAVKRYADAIGRENRVIELQDKLANQKEEVMNQGNSTSQLQTVLMNARHYVNSLNDMRESTNTPNYPQFIQRIVEAIASDVKSHGGERHRCGLWLETDNTGKLILLYGSSGFPEHYIQHRTLDIHDSIAGRSFRKKQVIKVDNVLEDSDWSPSETSNTTYKALVCIPLGVWGVITIDAREPLDENAQLIGELYGSILEGIMEDLFYLLNTQDVAEENTEENMEEVV